MRISVSNRYKITRLKGRWKNRNLKNKMRKKEAKKGVRVLMNKRLLRKK